MNRSTQKPKYLSTNNNNLINQKESDALYNIERTISKPSRNIIKKKLYIYSLLLYVLLIGSFNAFAKDYHVTLSVDNHINRSKNIACDISHSAISTLAYFGDRYNLNDNIMYRLGLSYSTFMVVLLNHEVAGHGFRGLELGSKLLGITIAPFSGSAYISIPYPYHIQKSALIELGGNEINYLLSQKIANNLVKYNQKIDPVSGAGYIFSGGNQLYYVYLPSTNLLGHDLVSYSDDMELMYGENAMSMRKIRSVGFLDILDPIMLGSIYSVITGNHVDIPKIKLHDKLSVAPFARTVLAPYGVIEKKFGLYLFTDYTPIKLAFSYGIQSKKNQVKVPTDEKIERAQYILEIEGIDIYSSAFSGLEENEAIQNQTTYSIELSVLKLYEIGRLVIGMDAVFWKQPELFVQDSYRAESKNGYMFMINGDYKATDSIHLIAKLGYKTKGFVSGYDIENTPMFSFGIEYNL